MSKRNIQSWDGDLRARVEGNEVDGYRGMVERCCVEYSGARIWDPASHSSRSNTPEEAAERARALLATEVKRRDTAVDIVVETVAVETSGSTSPRCLRWDACASTTRLRRLRRWMSARATSSWGRSSTLTMITSWWPRWAGSWSGPLVVTPSRQK